MKYNILLIKINFFTNIFFFNYKSTYYLNTIFFNNYLFFFRNLYFFKKNNTSFKKLLNLSYYSNNQIKGFNSEKILLCKKTYIKKKYFIFFNFYNNKQFLNNSSLKLVDLKKKFYLNLISFKSNINIFLSLRSLKQKSYLKKFNYFIFFFKKTKFFFEYSLIHILLKLKFVYNYSDYFYLKQKNYIYLNRSAMCNNINLFSLSKSDILELTIHNFFFFYLSKLNFLFKNSKFINKKLNKKNLITNFFLADFFNKSLSIESSYKTNTIIILFNVFSVKHLTNYFSYYLNYYMTSLYKWK